MADSSQLQTSAEVQHDLPLSPKKELTASTEEEEKDDATKEAASEEQTATDSESNQPKNTTKEPRSSSGSSIKEAELSKVTCKIEPEEQQEEEDKEKEEEDREKEEEDKEKEEEDKEKAEEDKEKEEEDKEKEEEEEKEEKNGGSYSQLEESSAAVCDENKDTANDSKVNGSPHVTEEEEEKKCIVSEKSPVGNVSVTLSAAESARAPSPLSIGLAKVKLESETEDVSPKVEEAISSEENNAQLSEKCVASEKISEKCSVESGKNVADAFLNASPVSESEEWHDAVVPVVCGTETDDLGANVAPEDKPADETTVETVSCVLVKNETSEESTAGETATAAPVVDADEKTEDEAELGEKESVNNEGQEVKNELDVAGSCIGIDTEAGDGEKKTEDSEMPLLEILNVRSVVDEDKVEDKQDELVETMEVDSKADEDMPASPTCDVEDEKNVASKTLAATTAEVVAADDDGKKPENNKQTKVDADIKNYAADTMNELLGLFGYEKVDENVKDSLELGNKETSGDTEDALPGKEEDCSVKDVASNEEVDSESSAVTTDGKAAKSLGQGRQCSVCSKTRSCKYQVLMLGMTKFLCDDTCFKEFRMKQNITTSPTIKHIISENRPITRSLTHPKDYCNVCQKEIKNGMGLLPGVGENKPLCSEECMRNYQATQGLKRACAQCGGHIQSRSKCLTWEAMEFCNEECLGKYQSYLGSHCAFCNNAVQQTSLGKYCVRFGSDIKQFCSNTCLEEFKKGLKICSYCQKDISSGSEGFLAPVGDKGQFKEFCSQGCMEKFETMGNPTATQPSIQQCSVCNKITSVKVEVTFEGKAHRLCSEPCIAAFRYANKINTSICDTCHKFFDLDVSRQLSIQFEGSCKRFCTKACMNVFVLHHRKVVPCSWCKVKKYNFDMIERVDSNNHVQLFCSLNCLSLFRVSLNATSSRRIQCDYCHQMKPAQYHLTMSDASIRNFCSYPCVMQFQSQFTTVAPVVPPQPISGATTAKTTTQSGSTQSGTPVISSVMSLAPGQTQTTNSSKPIILRTQTAGSLVSTVAKSLKTVQTQTLYPAITQHVVVKQPVAKMQKNKTILCKPTVQTKGVSCKPHPCHKTTQTDEEPQKQLFVPIPVPIYVPVPMHMYTTPVPFPLAFPLPIPVPIFIPTTRNSAQGIFKQIKEIQEKIPDNPFEADLILMAEMVAEEGSSSKDKTRRVGSAPEKSPDAGAAANELAENAQNFDDVDSQLQDSCQTANSFGDEVLQMALRMASGMEEPVDLETALAGGAESNSRDSIGIPEENGNFLSARDLRAQARSHKRSGGRGRGRGRKKARTEETSSSPSSTPIVQQALLHPPPPYSYGVNAWKHWVLQKNMQLEKASQTNRKLKLFKTDILQLTADELNYSLCLFVKEVRKPNGDEYASDSIYYLCLGIQQYLFENGRIDNIFADAYYEKFTECLNDVLLRYEMTLSNEGIYVSRIEEEILWECKQLGAHSPHVLLNTLMYFNTKYFMLKTVDEHTQLSFSHILKHWKKGPGGGGGGTASASSKGNATGAPGRSALLRYYPPSQMKDSSSRKRKEVIPSYEQVENMDNPLRCPVKLYEFYLSKCPESIKNRTDIFYLYPERSCVPDSPVWYSTMPLGKETITKMLQRIKMVREVGETMVLS